MKASEELFFDQRLKQKAELKEIKFLNEESKCIHKIVRTVKIFLSFVYIFVTPYIMAEKWCLDAYRDKKGYPQTINGIFLECST